MTKTTDAQPTATAADIRSAYDRGASIAHSMVPGAVFRGAIPEADAAGYTKDSELRGIFITAFLAALPAIRADKNGVIVTATAK